MRRLLFTFALAAGCSAGPPGEFSAADSTSVPKFEAAVAAVGQEAAAMQTPKSERVILTIGEIKDGITHLGVRPVDRPERTVSIEVIVGGYRMGALQYDRSDFPLSKEFLIAVESYEWMEARINPNPDTSTWPKGTPQPGSTTTNNPNPDDPANPHGPGNPGVTPTPYNPNPDDPANPHGPGNPGV